MSRDYDLRGETPEQAMYWGAYLGACFGVGFLLFWFWPPFPGGLGMRLVMSVFGGVIGLAVATFLSMLYLLIVIYGGTNDRRPD